jgi:hypothetical protein
LGVAAGAALILGQASPATAAGGSHTVSITENVHGTFPVGDATDFCTGEPISPMITGNEVNHVTFFPGGDEVWGTFTMEGVGSFVQPSSGLTYSGRVVVWGNFNVNNKNSNDTFTATFKLSAVDASGVTHYEVGNLTTHVTYNAVDPTSPVVSFDKMNATCS